MTTHTCQAAGLSQSDLILRHLELHRGSWVPMPELVEVSGSYNVHSRVSDLRRRGIEVLHRQHHEGNKIHSFYRIA